MSRQAVVPSLRCADHAPLRYVVMSAGRVCCASDTRAEMCGECQAATTATPTAPPPAPPPVAAAPMAAEVRPTRAAVPVPAEPPTTKYADPPPSLRAMLEAKRPSLREQLERRIGGHVGTAATGGGAAGYADPPPSLADRLRSNANRP